MENIQSAKAFIDQSPENNDVTAGANMQLSGTQRSEVSDYLTAIEKKDPDFFAYNEDTWKIVEPGTMASGNFIEGGSDISVMVRPPKHQYNRVFTVFEKLTIVFDMPMALRRLERLAYANDAYVRLLSINSDLIYTEVVDAFAPTDDHSIYNEVIEPFARTNNEPRAWQSLQKFEDEYVCRDLNTLIYNANVLREHLTRDATESVDPWSNITFDVVIYAAEKCREEKWNVVTLALAPVVKMPYEIGFYTFKPAHEYLDWAGQPTYKKLHNEDTEKGHGEGKLEMVMKSKKEFDEFDASSIHVDTEIGADDPAVH
ncbi:uncharacterized protein LY89DRAFT_727585 [Mollisia scopiformis]|uniref:Uncharacterized protein n=1 Tax=Mollisia scopiformis TaxID=149040 RepID=A0A194XWF7_MOLSC|nr:uncharacterized protein LY89DRAFT_727585 [Mollisia scopiformis]KUJ24563.1 hypothetical protein LY89DRAFT_727585 [Mollisia scopiformis]